MTNDSTGVLLGVAGRLFRERGFAATTVREIAAAAGLLPGSLHYRFATKEELLLALMERGMRRTIAQVRAAMARERDPLERIRGAMRPQLKLLI